MTERATVPTGNVYDKYGSTNPVVRRLMMRFEATLDQLWQRVEPGSVLDVGCGEGILTERWAMQNPDVSIVGIDLEDPTLRAEWERRRHPNLQFRAQEASELPFEDGEFELVTAIEVLEHLSDPRAALAEMRRVAGRYLLVSVPREPLWRFLNLARGAYWRTLGDTPGHLNHWSPRSFGRLLADYGAVEVARSPVPWTMLLVNVAVNGSSSPRG